MIGKLLREKRIERGMTQTELARRSSVNNQELCKIEKEKVSPNFVTVELVCEALGVDFILVDREKTDGEDRS